MDLKIAERALRQSQIFTLCKLFYHFYFITLLSLYVVIWMNQYVDTFSIQMHPLVGMPSVFPHGLIVKTLPLTMAARIRIPLRERPS